MAENNKGFDIISGLRKFFNFIDHLFTIADRQYSSDGSSKFTVTHNGSIRIPAIDITCIPKNGKLSMKFSTKAEVAEGQNNPLVIDDVEIGDTNKVIKEVISRWFNGKYDEKQPEGQSESNEQDTSKEEQKEESEETSEEQSKDEDQYDNFEDPYGGSMDGRTAASRILRFGLSKINGSHELMLTKVYANYDSEDALNDLGDFIDNSDPNELEDGCYELSYNDACDECFDVCPINDFELDYEDLMDQMLCSLYEVKLCGHAYQKMFTDPDVQVFYSIHPTIDSMIEFLEDTNFKLTGGVTWPTDYEYNHCGDCCYNTAYELLYDKYVSNLSNVLDCIRFYICHFEDESRNSLIQYQTALSEFLCKLEPVHTELVETEEPTITWEECFGDL